MVLTKIKTAKWIRLPHDHKTSRDWTIFEWHNEQMNSLFQRLNIDRGKASIQVALLDQPTIHLTYFKLP